MNKFLDNVRTEMVGIAGLSGGEFNGHASFGFASKCAVDINKVGRGYTRTEIYGRAGFVCFRFHILCIGSVPAKIRIFSVSINLFH